MAETPRAGGRRPASSLCTAPGAAAKVADQYVRLIHIAVTSGLRAADRAAAPSAGLQRKDRPSSGQPAGSV